jgi:uncharacterized protein with PIN domain
LAVRGCGQAKARQTAQETLAAELAEREVGLNKQLRGCSEAEAAINQATEEYNASVALLRKREQVTAHTRARTRGTRRRTRSSSSSSSSSSSAAAAAASSSRPLLYQGAPV